MVKSRPGARPETQFSKRHCGPTASRRKLLFAQRGWNLLFEFVQVHCAAKLQGGPAEASLLTGRVVLCVAGYSLRPLSRQISHVTLCPRREAGVWMSVMNFLHHPQEAAFSLALICLLQLLPWGRGSFSVSVVCTPGLSCLCPPYL